MPHVDSYREDEKLADGTQCPECSATFWKGRWTWRKPEPEAPRERCPACRRIAEDFPAGFVTLRGSYVGEHRQEVLGVVKAREARAREEHPLQRIIGVRDTAGGLVVTTTDAHLARGIAHALQEAFKGSLDLKFSRGENLLRATWER